ncbi:hypothetical protein [Cohnella silvisoli]|uniref:Uncharacterized protein n=1 Tax=Cohnella silvisoli TaxID=2873699 RepID=A0ABV1KML2_9BACL|nr:hypothetical protein [Cohnella silvisoli]MCD9020344.1 hypothetical protein [Cohnella silvisoli]
MSLALHFAHMLIQNKLHALELTHLWVRTHGRNLIIYSIEHQEEVNRAILTLFPGNAYLLCIANHRGNWQPTPFVGTLPQQMSILTGKLAFALSRWH